MASPRLPQYSYNNQAHLPNGAPGAPGIGSASAGPSGFMQNNGRVVQAGGGRVLCVADVRGNLRSLNDLAKQARADYIIHTGDFGFYDESSLERIADKTLKHVAQYSPLLSEATKRAIQISQPQVSSLKQRFSLDQLALSELSMFISKQYSLEVPVYTVWGACEDVRVLEKFRSGEYKVDKLHIIDEANSRLLDIGGVKLRLLGLGGAVVMHKLFDNGEGRTTIAGGQGTMWTTLLQMGELVDTANRVYDPTETRVFITHASPAREGLLNQLSVTLKADFSISAGLHFRYGSSYNEFSVNPTLDHYRGKLAASKASFNDVWETVKSEVEPAVSQNEAQQTLLSNALDIVSKMPTIANGGNPFGGQVPGPGAGGQVDESAFKNMWNFNLADAAFGYLVLEVEAGRIGTEMRAQGFNFAHRGASSGKSITQPVQAPIHGGPTNAVMQGTGNMGAPPIPVGQGQTRPPVAPSAQPSQQMNQNQRPNSQPRNQPQQSFSNQPSAPSASAKQQPPPPQQPKAPTNPPKTASPAPAPAPAAASQTKPDTPQPSSANVNLPSAPSSEKPATNGTAAKDKPAPQPNDKPSSPAVERKPSTALFVHNLDNEDAVKAIFSDEERWKILRVEKHGRNHVVHFSTHEEAKNALERQPLEHKKSQGPPQNGQPRKPNVKFYDERGPTPRNFQRDSQGGQGAGQWQASNRGGAAGAGGRGGYQSGNNQSGASDSEGGRGRGGYNRGRGGRGERGGRGRGGARGSFNNKASGGEDGGPSSGATATGDVKSATEPKPSTSTSAPAADKPAAPSGGDNATK